MEITYSEGILLALYLEFFNRCYDPTDDRVCDLNTQTQKPTRHMEMQNLIYILQLLYIELPDYGFFWQGLTPYSEGLELTLREIDEKGYSVVDEFYMEYNKTRNQEHHNSYTSQLTALMKEYFRKSSIHKIAYSSLALENILKQDEGSKTLAAMVYAMYNGGARGRGSEELNEVLRALQNRGWTTPPSPELTQGIWEVLARLGLREQNNQENVKVFINNKLKFNQN